MQTTSRFAKLDIQAESSISNKENNDAFFHNQTFYTAHGVQRKKKKNKFFNFRKICVLVLEAEKVIIRIENVTKTPLQAATLLDVQ